MTTEPTELDEQKTSAVRTISDSIGKHQFVKRVGLLGFTCLDPACASKGTVFLTRKDQYDHQAIVAVNDLLSSLRWDRGWDLEDQGVEEADLDKDFTYSLLTDILDATPAGRSYADRKATQEARNRDGFSTIEEPNLLFGRFLTAPATGEAQPGSAMAKANADSDALAPARAEMLSQLQERYGKAAE